MKDNQKAEKMYSQRILQPELALSTLTSDSNEFKKLPVLKLQKSEMINGELKFDDPDKFEQALQDGFFLVKVPSQMNLMYGDKLAHNFYKQKNTDLDDDYKGFKHVLLNKTYQGYFDREDDQSESFYIEESNWSATLPTDLQILGYQMIVLGISLLENILKKLEIPGTAWEKVTGGTTTHTGHQMLTFNHFRPEKDVRGMKFHKDSGWVTLLRSTEPGLIALLNNELFSIVPEEGFFVVNFGHAMEVLTEKLKTPLKANKHGVVKTKNNSDKIPDRTSYALFLDSNLKSNVYKYENGKAIFLQTMDEFIEDLHQNT